MLDEQTFPRLLTSIHKKRFPILHSCLAPLKLAFFSPSNSEVRWCLLPRRCLPERSICGEQSETTTGVKARSTWALVCAKFLCRFEVKICGDWIEAAMLCASLSSFFVLHRGAWQLYMAGGWDKTVKFSAGFLYPSRLPAAALSSQGVGFWFKKKKKKIEKEREREQQEWKWGRNSTLPWGAAAPVGDFRRCSSHQQCFCCWKKRNAFASSAYVFNSLNPVKKGPDFSSCLKWLKIKTHCFQRWGRCAGFTGI